MASRFTFQEMERCVAEVEAMRKERMRLQFTREHYTVDLSRGNMAMATTRLKRAEEVKANISRMQPTFDDIARRAEEALDQNPGDRRALLIKGYVDGALMPPENFAAHLASLKSLKARVQKEKDLDNTLSLW